MGVQLLRNPRDGTWYLLPNSTEETRRESVTRILFGRLRRLRAYGRSVEQVPSAWMQSVRAAIYRQGGLTAREYQLLVECLRGGNVSWDPGSERWAQYLTAAIRHPWQSDRALAALPTEALEAALLTLMNGDS